MASPRPLITTPTSFLRCPLNSAILVLLQHVANQPQGQIMNAFVTGGSRGIGRAIVLRMVEEGHGCAFTYRTNSQAAEETISLAREINPKSLVRSYQIDIRNPREVESCVEEAIKDFKHLQIIVNNAAVVRDNVTVMMSDEEWDEVIATNLSGPFYVIRSFLMHLIAKRKGRIINISSSISLSSSQP